MREYILYLLKKQKSLTLNELLKKTRLQRGELLQMIHSLAQHRIFFMDLSTKNKSACTMCGFNNFCKHKEILK